MGLILVGGILTLSGMIAGWIMFGIAYNMGKADHE